MVVITRSLAPILRTSRLAIRQQKGVNPVHQVFGKDANGIRGLATVFERSKPHVNIGTNYLCCQWANEADLHRHHWSRRPWQGARIASSEFAKSVLMLVH